MTDNISKTNTGATPGAPLNCEEWEALLADTMDGTLAPEAETAFADHTLKCPGCNTLFEQAQRGQEWLKLLEEHAPEAPVDLLSKILAQTQGAGREADYAVGTGTLAGTGGAASLPGQGGRWGIPFLPHAGTGPLAARGAHNARLLMTAGMALFSVALTLSVAGVRLTSVHAAELRPQAVQANVSRSFYGTKKQVVSFYENLRLVYEVESKMHDLRHDSDGTPARQQAAPVPQGGGGSAPGTKPAPKAHVPAGGHASTGATSPRGRGVESDSRHPEQIQQVLHGWPVLVNYQPPPNVSRGERSECLAVRREASAPFGTLLVGATSKERNRT